MLVLFLAFSSLIFVVRPLLGDVPRKDFLTHYGVLIVGILAVAATAATWIARRFFDRKSFVSLGFRWSKYALRDLFFGIFLSAAMAAAFFGLTYALGYMDYQGINPGPENTPAEFNWH